MASKTATASAHSTSDNAQHTQQAEFLAHTHRPADLTPPRHHGLADHLASVAQLATGMAAVIGPLWAFLAGQWHDLGKFRRGFQQYVRQDPNAHIEGRQSSTISARDKSHSAAGALHALRVFEERFNPTQGRLLAKPLMYVIAGHHAGLDDWDAGLDDRLLGSRKDDSEREYQEARAACQAAEPWLLAWPETVNGHTLSVPALIGSIPGTGTPTPLPMALSLWIRMLFSTLVDADFLDTERFMDLERYTSRQKASERPLREYMDALDAHLTQKATQVSASGRFNDPVMTARQAVLQDCRNQAALPPGVFTLTVPTGGGKTLSSLAFALHHACAHQKRRVIYAIPYTSIIEQTAQIFKDIFGPDAVIEHHSQADADDSRDTLHTRLACENWDAPLIVTTNVQLFESLFAARTSRCRKLHRLVNSVIVLDEAQLLPPTFLQPILDVLNLLVQHYGVTVLLCTATQPTLATLETYDPRYKPLGLQTPTPIVSQEADLYRHLHRVNIEWPQDLNAPTPIDAVAAQIAQQDCVLSVVNTRQDAAVLLREVDTRSGERNVHLSAAMCGQHRADVIAQMRHRLHSRLAPSHRASSKENLALRVISTQLIEAGVDVDFPVVYRALAGLDSIAQAAGRCNREGRLPDGQKGRMVVFVRDIPAQLDAVRIGAQATRSTLGDQRPAELTPEDFQRYFPLYYRGFESLDVHGIVDLLNRGQTDQTLSFDFRKAAQKFKLVDDEAQASLIIPYASTSPTAADPRPLIQALRQGSTDRWRLRELQRYIVNVRLHTLEFWQIRGDVEEVQPGLFVLVNELLYDDRLGLLSKEGQPMDAGRLYTS